MTGRGQMGKRKGSDPYQYFREMTPEEQLQNMLDVAAFCIDGAPVSLARKIEIYFGVTEPEQVERHMNIRAKNRMGP
jgi:hypothetical protein